MKLSPLTGVHWLTLHFTRPEQERAFNQQHLRSSLITIRAFITFGTLLIYSSYGILDRLLMPDMYQKVWLIRLGVILYNIGIALPLTYTDWFFRRAQVLLGSLVISTGGSIVVMIAIAPEPVSRVYYAGLIIVFLYCASFIRLHHFTSLLTTVMVFCCYQAVALRLTHLSTTDLITNDFFLIASIVMGTFSSYVQEIYVRRNFLSLEQLAEGKAKAEQLQIAAEAASRTKSEFLAIMGHELRTPLNAIIGFSDMMRQEMMGPIGNQRYADYARDIFESGNHLLDIINNILDLSKAEAGKLVLDESEVDMDDLTHRCIRVFREIAAERGVRLSLVAPRRPVVMWADERLCKHIVFNLVSNAVKFTNAGGEVTASFEFGRDDAIILRIDDTGIGIAESDLPRVVEPFVQVDSSLSRKYGGTGLGLPLVKKIAELHGARLVLSSQLGVGTSVSVHFPAERTVATVDEAREPVRVSRRN